MNALVALMQTQGQPIAVALFGDLALEHQLLDRARYLEALTDTADHADTRNLARRLQAAQQETIDWINQYSSKKRRDSPPRCGRPRYRRRLVGSPVWSATQPAGPLNGSTGPQRPLPAPAHASALSLKPWSIP